MAEIDIFISYKSERRKAAEHLAAVLTLYGYSVWFDYQLIKGSDFGLQIDRRIREAKALVALWCSLSVGSRWVIEEVDLAYKLGILIPVMIEPCELPVGFREPAHLWQFYIQLVEVEAAFKNLKDDLQLRPIYHQLEHRVEAHTFVAFLVYCLHVTLRAQLKPLAPASPRAPCSTSSPPSRCSTFTSRLAMAGR